MAIDFEGYSGLTLCKTKQLFFNPARTVSEKTASFAAMLRLLEKGLHTACFPPTICTQMNRLKPIGQGYKTGFRTAPILQDRDFVNSQLHSLAIATRNRSMTNFTFQRSTKAPTWIEG